MNKKTDRAKIKKDRVPFKTKFVETEISSGFATFLTVFMVGCWSTLPLLLGYLLMKPHLTGTLLILKDIIKKIV